MKLKFIYKVIFAVATVVSVSSCDDFLTQDNPNATYVKDYYTTVDRCEAALTGVYNAFKNENIYAIQEDNLRSDIGVEGGQNSNRVDFNDQAYLHSYTDTYSSASNKWAALYTGIRRCNDLLAGIEVVRPTITKDAGFERIDIIEAQTLFMRGLFYFYITVTFRHDMKSDLCAPLILESITNVDNLAQPLATASAIREQYRKDLLDAIELGLPEEWTDVDDVGRVTSGAANAILGMSYLYQATDSFSKYYTAAEGDLSSSECYALARAYFKKIIDSGYYDLAEPGSSDPFKAYNFTLEGEFNCESILEVSYALSDNTNLSGESLLYNKYPRKFSIGTGGSYTCIPSFWLMNEFMTEMPDEKIDDNWVQLKRDPFYGTLNSDGEEIRDVVYTQIGESCVNDPYDTNANPGYLYDDSIVHRYESTVVDEVTGEELEDVYEESVYKRSIIYRKDVPVGGKDRVKSITYTSLFPYGTRRVVKSATEPIVQNESMFKSKVVGDNIYRIRKYSTRASYTMAINGDIDLFYYGQKTPQMWNYFALNKAATGGVFRKNTNWDTRAYETDATIVTSSGINYRLIRLADVYLMYAEALIEGGRNSANLQEALLYVNRVRRRAGTILIGSKYQSTEFSDSEATFDGDAVYAPANDDEGFTGCAGPLYQAATGNMTAKELMYHLMWVERPMELCMEGYMTRVCDLRRWTNLDTDEYNLTRDRFFDLANSPDYRYYFTNAKFLNVNATTGAFSAGTTVVFPERYSYFEQANVDDGETYYQDYVGAASVYGEWDWYYPVPNTEKVSNPYIN